MDHIDFASQYRPRRFQDVYGQDSPVGYISGLIKQGQFGQNLLLHGSVGSGKTSLVRLYALALNCEQPDLEGSPCGSCKFCDRSRIDDGYQEYDVSGEGGDKDAVVRWVDYHNRTPHWHRHRLLFLDEAHSLTPAAADALLKTVEEPAKGVHFCFATTEIGAIRPALLSRLHPLEIRPLSMENSIALLKHVADQQDISYEIPALALLASLKNCYPRDLLNGLSQVYGPGKRRVDLDNVRKEFDADHTEHLVEYFRALAQGDAVQQEIIFFGWKELGFRKVGWIQAFLTSLYYSNIVSRNATIDALTHLISAVRRREITDLFCRRLEIPSPRELAPLWHLMLSFWPVLDSNPDEVAVDLRVTLFHHLVNDELPIRARAANRDLVQSPIAPLPSFANEFAPTGTLEKNEDDHTRFPALNDARTIINNASFLVQEHDVRFNARFEVWPRVLGFYSESAGVQLILQFCSDLETAVQRWGGERHFAGMMVLERYEGQVRGLVLVYLPGATSEQPIDCLKKAEGWHRTWSRERGQTSRLETVTFQSEATNGAAAWQFHWRQTLNLCAGLDLEIQEFDPKQDRDRPLREILEIPKRQWRGKEVGPINVPLVRAYGLLRPRFIEEASRYGMKPLSAFDQKQWLWIQKRWESQEFHARSKERRSRSAELDSIALRCGIDTPEADRERRRVQNSWSDEWERDWQGWWT